MSLRELPEDLKPIASAEINEDIERIPNDFKTLKEWLQKQPHIHARTDDQWLIAFIRSSKYRMEKVKEKLENFYTFKTAFPKIMKSIDPYEESIQSFLKLGKILPLLKCGYGGSRVVLCRFNLSTNESMLNDLRAFFMLLEMIMVQDDNAIVAGIHLVVDFDGFKIDHMKPWTPTIMRNIALIMQEGLPMRFKGSHYINVQPIVEKFCNMVKLVANKKTKERFTICGNDFTQLFAKIPQEIFPDEYGGSSGPIQSLIDHWKNKMEENREWFIDNMKYKTDESIRPKKTKLSDSLFGIEGSFRELRVD